MFTTPSIVYSLQFNCEFSWSLSRFTLSNYYYINQSRESKIEDFVFHGFHSFSWLHKLFNKIPLLLNSMTWNNIPIYVMNGIYFVFILTILNGATFERVDRWNECRWKDPNICNFDSKGLKICEFCRIIPRGSFLPSQWSSIHGFAWSKLQILMKRRMHQFSWSVQKGHPKFKVFSPKWGLGHTMCKYFSQDQKNSTKMFSVIRMYGLV